jgi:hypothetical protein
LPRPSQDREVAFSPAQWIEFAKAVGLNRIPPKEQREICNAIVAYDFSRAMNERAADEADDKSTRRKVDPRAKGLAALKNFIKYVRGLRQALESVEFYLKAEISIKQAGQLREQIYNFQKVAENELNKKSVGGRPQQQIRDHLVIGLGVIYERLTGKKPTRTGPFAKFVYAIFRARGISTVNLPNVIEKAVRHAKNQH